MTRQTKTDLQRINADIMNKLQTQTAVASQYYKELELLKRQLAISERRFDTLLEGMCMGMKEGALPRRHA